MRYIRKDIHTDQALVIIANYNITQCFEWDNRNGNRRIEPTQNWTHEIKNVFMMLILG